ncbi:4-hydroxybenzoate 3-monooxygenase [Rugosimonospora africana]|uniref:4-hydroxybenzoate 3-monooxygenase n=1 Tax=Rugosimonospora africana TaxID=556532 RepID=A0A8J3QS38_9ACTN|nr:4-hydroxybenzoate 3-monooxygenase [Rugosimonospora africana]GIH14573.1 4-hydroxybenzoate 3-monooxygenase [Rugosimonospora africana]
MRTQVGIVGAGPAGLLLSQLLALHGIDSVVVDDRSQEHIVARARAGVLEHGSAELLRRAGLGARMDREGIVHGGIYLQYDGVREHLDFRDLAGGRTVMVYAQTEVVKDLVAARLAAGANLVFEVRDTEVDELTSDHPVLRYTTPDGVRHDVVCDVIAGCDGFHGVSRPSIPDRALTIFDRTYPYAWLGILARVPPSTDELIYAYHRDGFALHSLRGPEVSRLYLQVAPDEQLSAWPDERIWTELRRRFALPGWELADGPIFDRSVTPMRSFVASPMRYGRLFLAGDAAHIVPPTGAKGLNLAVADVAVLAEALVALLRDGNPDLADAYSDNCLRRVWRATHFSWWMTSMLHRAPDGDEMREQLQLSQLRYTTSSRAAATTLAENYVGYPPLDLGGLDLPAD